VNGGKAKAANADVAQLAADYGLTDVAPPERGKPAVRVPDGMTVKEFRPNGAPGWQGQYAVDQGGGVHAMCTPTGITARMPGKNIIDRPLTKHRRQDLGAASQVQGSWGDSSMIKAAVEGLK
jgi:hypothetical protein